MSHHTGASHSVYVQFVLLDNWQIHILEKDLTTSLATWIGHGPDKIRALARNGGALGTPEARAFLESAIERGRGDLYLRLTPEQYSELRRSDKESSVPPPS
jgi:hypothetical protein